MTAEHYDAFVSYGHGDAEWAQAFAENLQRLGLRVFLDKWELVAGDLIAVRLQQGLAAADAVVFVVSAESVGRGWVDEELAAAIAAAVARRQRLIPVLAGEAPLPPFAASRLYLDFRNVDSPPAYETKLSELAAAIRGQPSSARPAPGGGIVPPPGAYRAEGPRSARLTIGGDVVTFSEAGKEADHRELKATGKKMTEAVRNEGLVSRERNRGAWVRPVTLEEAIEITEVRAVLEGLCAAEAAAAANRAEQHQSLPHRAPRRRVPA